MSAKSRPCSARLGDYSTLTATSTARDSGNRPTEIAEEEYLRHLRSAFTWARPATRTTTSPPGVIDGRPHRCHLLRVDQVGAVRGPVGGGRCTFGPGGDPFRSWTAACGRGSRPAQEDHPGDPAKGLLSDPNIGTIFDQYTEGASPSGVDSSWRRFTPAFTPPAAQQRHPMDDVPARPRSKLAAAHPRSRPGRHSREGSGGDRRRRSPRSNRVPPA